MGTGPGRKIEAQLDIGDREFDEAMVEDFTGVHVMYGRVLQETVGCVMFWVTGITCRGVDIDDDDSLLSRE